MSVVDKCSLQNRDNLMQPIHMQLSQKLKTVSRFILHFRNFCRNLLESTVSIFFDQRERSLVEKSLF